MAAAFAIALAFTTLPTPLWSLYAARDHFSSLMITIVFAAYAVGVALSLFLVGHVSDWYGRRRVFLPALLLNVVAGILFLLWPALPGLLAARVISGLGIGAVNATATAWLMDLDAAAARPRGRPRAEVVAAAANLGGLGAGGLVSGMLAQWGSHPLSVPFLVLIAALFIAVVLVLLAPETQRPVAPPPYRPQRITVPAQSRGLFVAAAIAAVITFALFGLVTSLAPSFLAGTLRHHSPALAGSVSFATFAAAAAAQALSGTHRPQRLLAAAIPAMFLGLGLLTLSVWLPRPSLDVFTAGVVVSGFAGGLMFKGALGTVAALSEPESRAQAMAGLFLAAYLGLAGPVIGLGVLTQFVSAPVTLLVFAGLLASALLLVAPRLLAPNPGPPSSLTATRAQRSARLHIDQAVFK